MKLSNHLMAVVGGALLTAGASLAQTNPVDAASQPKVSGQVVLPERLTADDANLTAAANTRPALAERPKLPPPVASPVERFKLEARAYLAREETLKKKLQGANDDDRAAIRERIKMLREQWAERARELRKEFKERRDELSARMPDRQELFNSIDSKPAQSLKGGEIRTRPRTGP